MMIIQVHLGYMYTYYFTRAWNAISQQTMPLPLCNCIVIFVHLINEKNLSVERRWHIFIDEVSWSACSWFQYLTCTNQIQPANGFLLELMYLILDSHTKHVSTYIPGKSSSSAFVRMDLHDGHLLPNIKMYCMLFYGTPGAMHWPFFMWYTEEILIYLCILHLLQGSNDCFYESVQKLIC